MLVETWEKKRGLSKSRFLFLVFNTRYAFDDHVTFREEALFIIALVCFVGRVVVCVWEGGMVAREGAPRPVEPRCQCGRGRTGEPMRRGGWSPEWSVAERWATSRSDEEREPVGPVGCRAGRVNCKRKGH